MVNVGSQEVQQGPRIAAQNAKLQKLKRAPMVIDLTTDNEDDNNHQPTKKSPTSQTKSPLSPTSTTSNSSKRTSTADDRDGDPRSTKKVHYERVSLSSEAPRPRKKSLTSQRQPSISDSIASFVRNKPALSPHPAHKPSSSEPGIGELGSATEVELHTIQSRLPDPSEGKRDLRDEHTALKAERSKVQNHLQEAASVLGARIPELEQSSKAQLSKKSEELATAKIQLDTTQLKKASPELETQTARQTKEQAEAREAKLEAIYCTLAMTQRELKEAQVSAQKGSTKLRGLEVKLVDSEVRLKAVTKDQSNALSRWEACAQELQEAKQALSINDAFHLSEKTEFDKIKKDLEKEKSRAGDEAANYKANIQSLEQTLQELKAAQDTYESGKASIGLEKETAETKARDLEVQLTTQVDLATQLKKDKYVLLEKYGKLSVQNENLRASFKILEEHESTFQNKRKQLEKTLKEKEEAWQKARERLIAQSKDNVKVQDAMIQEISARNAQLLNEFEELKSKEKTAEARYKSLVERFGALKDESKRLAVKGEQQDLEKETAEANHKANEGDRKRLEAENIVLQSRLVFWVKAQLRTQQLEREVKDLTATQENIQVESKVLQTRIKDHETEALQTKVASQELEKKNAELMACMTTLALKKEKAQLRVQSLEEELEKAGSVAGQLREATADLARARETIQDFQGKRYAHFPDNFYKQLKKVLARPSPDSYHGR